MDLDGKVVLRNYINGKYTSSSSYIDSYNPSTGKVWAQVPDSNETDISEATVAAKRAFPMWSALPAHVRAKYLTRIADILESKSDEFAEVESCDQGKPVSLAKAIDIPRSVLNFRFFASACQHVLGSSRTQPQFGTMSYATRQASGVAGIITPWNLPMYLLTFKIAPALAAGNTVVAKPSEITSATAWMLCKVFEEAELPAGVVNMVFGSGAKAGEAIVKHPGIRMISFTGSGPVGARITEASSHFWKKVSLELGGKNAGIVFDDVNMDACVEGLIRGSFTNQGEICLCTSRIFVQTGIFHSFLEKFVKATRNIKVGDPKDPNTKMGPLVSIGHLAKVKSYVAAAKADGATIQCGEGVDPLELPPGNEGYYMRPTVITNIADTHQCMQDEIFGPVTCIVPFEAEEEVIIRANSVKYGLCASVWTQNVSRTHRVAQKLEVGTVWCNCWLVRDLNMPFGGIKATGNSFDGLNESFEFYTEPKSIYVKVYE